MEQYFRIQKIDKIKIQCSVANELYFAKNTCESLKKTKTFLKHSFRKKKYRYFFNIFFFSSSIFHPSFYVFATRTVVQRVIFDITSLARVTVNGIDFKHREPCLLCCLFYQRDSINLEQCTTAHASWKNRATKLENRNWNGSHVRVESNVYTRLRSIIHARALARYNLREARIATYVRSVITRFENKQILSVESSFLSSSCVFRVLP